MTRQFKTARKMKNIKLVEAAKLLGISQPSLSAWESGRKSPTLDGLEKMADLYGVTTDFLLGRNQHSLPKHDDPILQQALRSMHGEPVWSDTHGWMMVDAITRRLIIDSETSLTFQDAGELYAVAPAFSLTDRPTAEPVSKSELSEYEEVWLEPISSDTQLRSELRGWYKVKDRFAENEFGNRFYLDTYGSKWLAFKKL